MVLWLLDWGLKSETNRVKIGVLKPLNTATNPLNLTIQNKLDPKELSPDTVSFQIFLLEDVSWFLLERFAIEQPL